MNQNFVPMKNLIFVFLFLGLFTLSLSAETPVNYTGDPVETVLEIDSNQHTLWIYAFVKGKVLIKTTDNDLVSEIIVESGKSPISVRDLSAGSYTLTLLNEHQSIQQELLFKKL